MRRWSVGFAGGAAVEAGGGVTAHWRWLQAAALLSQATERGVLPLSFSSVSFPFLLLLLFSLALPFSLRFFPFLFSFFFRFAPLFLLSPSFSLFLVFLSLLSPFFFLTYCSLAEGVVAAVMRWFSQWLQRWSWRKTVSVSCGRGRKKKKNLQKLGENAGFWLTLDPNLSSLRSSNPTLFIGSGRGKSCLCCGKITALDSVGKHLNRWLKVRTSSCQIWQLQAVNCPRWPLRANERTRF